MKSIILIGASFSTGNLGVNALAWSSIKIIRDKWLNADISFLGFGRKMFVSNIFIEGRNEQLPSYPVRFSPNIFVADHFVLLFIAVLFCRLFPFLKKYLISRSSTLGVILRCDMFCDITGGDSFSDIYGIRRFLRGYLLKRMCQMTNKPFILLPQTYGPFSSAIARRLARTILEKSAIIYSRDQEGTRIVEKMIGASRKIRLCPDVAFIMETRSPDTTLTLELERIKKDGHQIVGFNISGLLYNGGYSRDNMFGLTCDYHELVGYIMRFFTQRNNYVLLVPHVLPSSGFLVEDDLIAAKEAMKNFPREVQDKTIVMERGYDHNETKYIIGFCDFFLGSRMHATIAAISQGIPAVALAYSRKFEGVFEMAGVADCVLDMRLLNNEEIANGIFEIYRKRHAWREVLERAIPDLKKHILHIFDDIK